MSAWVVRQWQAWRDGLWPAVIMLGLIANLIWIGAGVFAIGLGITRVVGLLG